MSVPVGGLLTPSRVWTTQNASIDGTQGLTGVVKTSAASTNTKTVAVALGAMLFEIPRDEGGRIVDGSLHMTLGPRTYVDRGGRMYYNLNAATGIGTDGGSMDYQTGQFIPTDLIGVNTLTGTLLSCVETSNVATFNRVTFRTPVAPIRSGQLSITGTLADGNSTQFTETFGTNGYLVSDHAVGYADYEAGIATVYFRAAAPLAPANLTLDLSALSIPGVTTINCASVLASTFRFNCVGYSYLPVDADVLGIAPERLPSNGKVPIFTDGCMCVVHNTQSTAAQTVANGDTINCGRTRLSRVVVRGNDGKKITAGYSANLDTGVVSFANVTGYAQPVTVQHRVEDLIKVLSVDINGTINLARPLSHDYPAGSGVSSAMIIGDLKARVSVTFDQRTWTGAWADSVTGDSATASYDTIHNPIVVTNAGAFTERWALIFTSSTEFYLLGEHLGVVGSGNTATDFAPINPTSSTPYMTIKAAGFGAYWAAGNVLRINTIGAMAPIWQVLTCQMGTLSGVQFNPSIQIRGNVDRP